MPIINKTNLTKAPINLETKLKLILSNISRKSNPGFVFVVISLFHGENKVTGKSVKEK
jgi:hypothetical protein